MKFQLYGQPDYSACDITLEENDLLKVESSAMATMDSNIQMKSRMKGGLSRILTGESLFITEYWPKAGTGQITITPGSPGDMKVLNLESEPVYLASSCFVAATENIDLSSKWQGMIKGFFSGKGLFLIRCEGKGSLWINSLGSMFEVDVNGEFITDNGAVVGFTSGLEYEMRKIGGYKSFFFSGEGLGCHFRGKGKLWLQSRTVQALTRWIGPFRRVRKRRNN